jgi:hypothetical protein
MAGFEVTLYGRFCVTPEASTSATQNNNPVGDAAGEYLEMERGRYHAWIHVGIAFALEIALLAFLAAKGLHALFPNVDLIGFGVVAGTAASFLVYSDRWRCVEAYTSEWCTGIINISIIIVPFVAFLYANYRGLRKLWRR